MDHTIAQHDSEPKPFWRTRYAVGLVVLGAIAAYLLLSEHRAHFVFALPFLLLLACPLMHIFMHHGHKGDSAVPSHNHNGAEASNNSAERAARAGAKP